MVIDIVVVAVIIAFILIGWKRGFLLSVYALFSMIIAVALACVLSPIVSSGLAKTNLSNKLEVKISSYVETQLNDKFGANANISIEKAADELPLPNFITNKIADGVQDSAAGPIKSVSNSVGARSAGFVCSLIAFAVVFILVYIVMLVIKSVLKIATKLPLIKQADTIGGILIGFAEGVLFICVVALIISIFSSTQSVQTLLSGIEKSHIAKFIYENNFIGKIISGLM